MVKVKHICYLILFFALSQVNGRIVSSQTISGCDVGLGSWQSIIVNPGSGSETLVFDYKNCPLDVSGNAYMTVDVNNMGLSDLIVDLSYQGLWEMHLNAGRFVIPESEYTKNNLILFREDVDETSPWFPYFDQVRALPGMHVISWRAFDLKDVRSVSLTLSWENYSGAPFQVLIGAPYGTGNYSFPSISYSSLPMPLLDDMGQLKTEIWERKLDSKDQLTLLGDEDMNSYLEASFSDEFSQYGGWKNGPGMDATGYFHTAKYAGKWWFVDPEGYLFWSLGVTGAGNGGGGTPVTGRTALFPDFEEERSLDIWPLIEQETENNFINFYEINLLRKYGQERDSLHPQVTEGRMKSWGINTYGAWSGLPEKPEHPYTFIIHPLKSGLGAIEKMIDPFSEKYRASLKSLLESAQNRNNDPWNIGIFVNNELDWGEKEYIPDQVLTLDNSVPARLAMENFLQNKYTGIENLNASWNSNFDSFTSVNGAGSSSFTTAFRADMDKYLDLFADTYYSVAAEEVKAAMPNHLYLGSRLHSATFNNSIVQNAASRHCDVVSVNIYNYTVKDFSISMEADKPLIIGEFHFGTGTHGVWGVGLKSAYDPYQQGQLFKQYIKEAASNANIVGAHWFTWPDQMVTGRKDGENYRIGLVNVTDQPYPELINAVKETSEMMYDRRSGRDTINNSSNNLLPEQEAINIFPNPSDGSFKVITQNSDRTRISVFTTYGKQVYSGMHTNNSDIKLPETVKGPLFITIEDREYVWKGKIIVL